MSEIVEVIVKSGLVPQDNLDELRKWGLPIPPREEDAGAEFKGETLTNEGLCQSIEKALQDHGYVITRETDLDLIPVYLKTQRVMNLHVVMPEEDGQSFNVDLQIGLHTSGEYIIPWSDDSILDLMTNGETHVVDGIYNVFFKTAREVFYGQHKAFVLCASSHRERHVKAG